MRFGTISKPVDGIDPEYRARTDAGVLRVRDTALVFAKTGNRVLAEFLLNDRVKVVVRGDSIWLPSGTIPAVSSAQAPLLVRRRHGSGRGAAALAIRHAEAEALISGATKARRDRSFVDAEASECSNEVRGIPHEGERGDVGADCCFAAIASKIAASTPAGTDNARRLCGGVRKPRHQGSDSVVGLELLT